jgi:hypothetical protein
MAAPSQRSALVFRFVATFFVFVLAILVAVAVVFLVLSGAQPV